MAIESERTREFVAQVAADALARDSLNYFPEQPAEGNRMITVPGAWLPEWLLGGEQAKHIIPVVIGLGFEPFMDRRQPCPMV